MTNLISEVDPHGADTPAEFVTQLRRVRERSGLSYRQIAQRAQSAGHTLPASTLATMLSRTTLPREDLVVALLIACGGEAGVVEDWLAVRQRLAWAQGDEAAEPPPPEPAETPVPAPEAAETPVPADEPADPPAADPEAAAPGAGAARDGHEPARSGWVEPAAARTGPAGGAPVVPAGESVDWSTSDPQRGEPVNSGPVNSGPARPPTAPDRPGRSRMAAIAALAAVALVVVLAASVILIQAIGDRGTPGPGPTAALVAPPLPEPGDYQIRLAHSDLCLSERPPDENGRLYQAPCRDTIPDMSLAPIEGDVYQIHTYHPEFLEGCTGVEAASTEVGAWLGDDYCDQHDAKDFRLEPVSTPTPGFRLRPVHSGLCIGVPGGIKAEWQPVKQLACAPDNLGQVFVFDPRAPRFRPTSPGPSPQQS